jgi:hypothetical protein
MLPNQAAVPQTKLGDNRATCGTEAGGLRYRRSEFCSFIVVPVYIAVTVFSD